MFSFMAVYFGKWKDICECVTLSEYMHGNVYHLHNYGNCVRLFEGEGCTGSIVDIQGGVSSDSRDLNTVDFLGSAKSFSVCGDSAICTRFSTLSI